MKVYALHYGDRYRGGEILGVFAKPESALSEAAKILDKQIIKWWRRPEEKGIIRAWQSTWEEIIIYEYNVR